MPAEMEAHLRQLETQGYTVVPAAIPAAQLLQIRAAHDSVCDAIRATKPQENWCLVRCHAAPAAAPCALPPAPAPGSCRCPAPSPSPAAARLPAGESQAVSPTCPPVFCVVRRPATFRELSTSSGRTSSPRNYPSTHASHPPHACDSSPPPPTPSCLQSLGRSETGCF